MEGNHWAVGNPNDKNQWVEHPDGHPYVGQTGIP
jgi:hypothetical protein